MNIGNSSTFGMEARGARGQSYPQPGNEFEYQSGLHEALFEN